MSETKDVPTTTSRELMIRPKSIEELQQFAEYLSGSGMVPKQYRGKEHAPDIAVAILCGNEVGLGPMAAIQSIAVINGNPGMFGDAPLALVRASGMLEWIKETYDEKTETWTCRLKRKGEPADVVYEGTFGMGDARKIEVIVEWRNNSPVRGKLAEKDTYKNHGKRMCQFRARSFPLRDGFSDILKGLRQAEEFEEFIDVAAEHVTSEPIPMPERASNGTPKTDDLDQRSPETEHPEEQTQEDLPSPEKQKPLPKKKEEPPADPDHAQLKADIAKWIDEAPEAEIAKQDSTDALFQRMNPIPERDTDRVKLADKFMKRKQAIWKAQRAAHAEKVTR